MKSQKTALPSDIFIQRNDILLAAARREHGLERLEQAYAVVERGGAIRIVPRP